MIASLATFLLSCQTVYDLKGDAKVPRIFCEFATQRYVASETWSLVQAFPSQYACREWTLIQLATPGGAETLAKSAPQLVDGRLTLWGGLPIAFDAQGRLYITKDRGKWLTCWDAPEVHQ